MPVVDTDNNTPNNNTEHNANDNNTSESNKDHNENRDNNATNENDNENNKDDDENNNDTYENNNDTYENNNHTNKDYDKAIADTDVVTAVPENVTDVTGNATAVTENVIDVTKTVMNVTENVTTITARENNDEHSPTMENPKANNGKMIGKYWKVYTQRGSTLLYDGIVPFDVFLPSTALPIQMNTFSNHTVGFERIPVIPVRNDHVRVTAFSFATLIASQPQWVQELLEEYSYPVRAHTPHEIMDIHGDESNAKAGLLVVSDGSVIVNSMSHGWVIANKKGDVLVSGAAAAYGKGSSLRAEGYGMLAATMFMALVGIYTDRKDIRLLRLSDNEELINRCTAHQSYKYPYPNATTKGEFDVVEEIFRSSKQYSIGGNFKWVKGHQDDNKTAELSIEAILNIEADALAGDYQERNKQDRLWVTMLPSCPAMLDIHGVSITSKVFHNLVDAYTRPLYMSCVQKKFEWDDTTVNAIAWDSLSLALKRIDRRVLTTKICNSLLPTKSFLFNTSQLSTNTCPLCTCEETREHLLRCNHPSRVEWRRKVVKDLRSTLTHKNTGYAVIETMASAVTEWLDTGEVGIQSYPQSFRKVLLSQTDIGWHHLFNGKLSTLWFPRYESSRTHGTQGEERKTESYVWGASIVEMILRSHIRLWETRNSEVHGDKHTTDTRQKLETFHRRKAIHDIKKLYTMEDKIRPSDKFLFPDLAILLAKDTASLKEYLTSHRKAIHNSVAKWAHQHKQGARSIVGWICNQSNTNSRQMQQRDEKQRKRKRLLDGRQKEKRRKTKNKPKYTNADMQDYFHSIPTNRVKRQRRILETEHIDIEQNECNSMNLDTET